MPSSISMSSRVLCTHTHGTAMDGLHTCTVHIVIIEQDEFVGSSKMDTRKGNSFFDKAILHPQAHM